MVIAVDSVVYNMAGDEEDRPNYLKSLVARHILSGNTKDSMADVLRRGYLNGPGMRLKAFYRWSTRSGNYDLVGKPTGRLQSHGRVPVNKVAPEIPAPDGVKIEVRSAVVEYADPTYWAERYVLQNYPELYDTNWNFDYFRLTNTVRIDFAGSKPSESFAASKFDYEARYIYAYYNRIKPSGEEGPLKLFIYKIGSGNADLDQLVKHKAEYGEFFPFIPIRIDNKFISNAYKKQVYKQATAAYEKATSGDLKELIDELKKNEDLEDIDYTYVVFGTSLNTKEVSAKKYIYTFFQALMASQEGGSGAYSEYLTDMNAYTRSQKRWASWKILNDKAVSKGLKPLKEPPRLPTPSPTGNHIRIRGTGDVGSSYDIRLRWDYIREYNYTGRGKPRAEPGDIWFKAEKYSVGQETNVIAGADGKNKAKTKDIKSTKLKLYWQRSRTEYTLLEVVGAVHENTVYKGKSVKIDPKEALDDNDESGFIIPLHYDTWRSMRLVDTTQMSLACVYTVFNCYQERKRKWYESGIFRIFLVIVIAIASVVFTGGAGIGLLGAHMAVGTAFGLSGMSAAILGSVVNAMAALVLTTILEKVTQSLGILGPLVGFLLGALIGQFSASLVSGGAFSFNWSSLLNVDNLLKLTQAVGNTVVAGIQQDTMGIYEDWVDFQENADEAGDKIQEAYFKEIGYGAGAIDPMMLTEQRNDFAVETPSTFLTRTLMTGSEVAEMSRELLYDFPKYSLELPDAFSS